MAEKLKELLREYQEGKISRRDFMRQAVIITGSLAAANSLIGGLIPTRLPRCAGSGQRIPIVLTHNVRIPGQSRSGVRLSRPPDETREVSGHNRDPRERGTQRSRTATLLVVSPIKAMWRSLRITYRAWVERQR